MTPMFENHVMPYLEKRSGYMLFSRIMRIFGKGESTVEYELKDMMERQSNPTIAPYAKTGEMTLCVTARCKTRDEGEALVEPVVNEIIERIGDFVFDTNDKELYELCVEKLIAQGKTLSVAESCTGGMIASQIVSVAGCSACFLQGAVTYTDKAKHETLGVKQKTLENFSAVSEETAREMAEGMRRLSGSTYALATTGIAGPEGGTKEKPVGLVFAALASDEGTKVQRLELSGDRERIRIIAALHAFDLLRRELEKNEQTKE